MARYAAPRVNIIAQGAGNREGVGIRPVCFVVPDVLGKLAFLLLLATSRPVDEDDGGVLAYTRGIEEVSYRIL